MEDFPTPYTDNVNMTGHQNKIIAHTCNKTVQFDVLVRGDRLQHVDAVDTG